MKKQFFKKANPGTPEAGATDGRDIAIIGMACKMPGSDDVEDFWKQVSSGYDAVGDFPGNRKDDIVSFIRSKGGDENSVRFKRGAYIDDISSFDFSFFNISQIEASVIAPDQRVLLETCWHALEDAGYSATSLKGSSTGIYWSSGNACREYSAIAKECNPELTGMITVGNIPSIAASRLSYFLDLKGPSVKIDTACSSSLVALHMACNGIANGDCEKAVVAGVNILLSPFGKEGDNSGIGVESSTGTARTFDDESDGTGLGEGSIVFILKRLSLAVKDGDNIHAVIKGSATNHDGNSVGLTAPNVVSQEQVLLKAWRNAAIDPTKISYIEAHGTGTKLGDPIEISALTRAFRHFTDNRQFCAVGTVKTNIGHLDAAAGLAGVLKAVLSLKNSLIPPSIHFRRPNKRINFEESPVYVAKDAEIWSDDNKFCGVSSFGISGTNVHVVMTNYCRDKADETQEEECILPLSARTPEALRSLVLVYVNFFTGPINSTLTDVCLTAALGRNHFAHRAAFVFRGSVDILEQLRGWLNDRTVPGKNTLLHEIADQYLKGVDVNWDTVLHGTSFRKTSIPGYPFSRRKCWITPNGVGTSAQTQVGPSPKKIEVNIPVNTRSEEEIMMLISNHVASAFELPVEQVNVDAGFLEIGLDSVTIVQVRQLVKREFGVSIEMNSLFKEASSIRKLSKYIFEERSVTHVVHQEKKEIKVTTVAGSTTESFVPFQKIDLKKDDPFTEVQKRFISGLIDRYNKKTLRSKTHVQESRRHFANNRNIVGYKKTWRDILYPLIADKSKGSRVWDKDGNEYIDFSMGFGVFLFGYNSDFISEAVAETMSDGFNLGPINSLASDVARKIHDLSGVDRVAFYNSGTEAVMVALRLARAATSKSKIVVFAGSYHGSFDGVLAQRDPFSVDHKGMPLAGGIPEKMIDDLYILPYGDLSSLEFIRDHAHELAGVLVEPVQSRKPSLQPAYFLRQLDSICKSNDVPFIVDEIITGFRIHPGGAQAWFGIKGDLVLYGKVIGGGMPLGIVAGSERFMTGIDGGFYDFKDNSHPVLDHRRTFVAGTFCHHPVTLAASNAALDHLIKNGYNLQANLNKRTTKLALDLNDFFKKHRIPIYMEQFGSLFHFTSAADITLLTYLLVDKGIYVWEGKTYFLSTAHSEDDILFFQRSVEMSCLELASAGFFGSVTLDVHALNLLPMTEEQRRLYQVDSLSKERSSAFHEHFVIHLPLSTDLQVVRDTIEQVMHRHEILRVVKIDDTNMFVDNNVKVPFMKYSISQVEEAGWKTLVHEIVYEAFDFNQGPFFRVAVLKRTSGISIVFCIHHIISDGWSLATIRKELATIYDGIINSRPVLLPWPAQFSDFVRHNASGNVDRENEIADFWIDQFASDTDQFIPFAERQITSADARPAVISIDEKQLTAIRAISLQNKSTLFTTTLGIFKTWLDSVTGSKDHVIWVPFAGQMAMLEQDLVGQCVQMLPFRWMADRSRSWKDNISEVNTVVNQMYTNSQWSVESMTKRATDLGKEFFLPATEIAFNMDMKIHEDVVQSTDSISSKARYKLFANAVEVGKSMVITLEYDSALIPAEIMKEWMGNFSSILQTLITDISNEYHHYLSLGVTTVPRLYSDLRLSINDKTHDARPAIKHHDKKMSFAQLAKFSSLLSQYIASKYEREHKKGVAIVMDNYVLGLSAAWASIRLQIPFLFLHPADIQTANTKEYVVISQRDHFDKTASPYLVFLDDEKEAIMGMKGGGFVDHRLIRYLHSLSNGDDVILETSLSEWCGRMMPENIVPGEQLMIVTEGLKGSQVIDVMLAASLYGLETEIIDSSLSHTTNWVVTSGHNPDTVEFKLSGDVVAVGWSPSADHLLAISHSAQANDSIHPDLLLVGHPLFSSIAIVGKHGEPVSTLVDGIVSIDNNTMKGVRLASGQICLVIQSKTKNLATITGDLDEKEQGICRIASEILGKPITDLYADLFELGLNSLKAMQLQSKLKYSLGLNITIGDLLRGRSINAILSGSVQVAEHLLPKIAPIEDNEPLQLSFLQKRVWVSMKFGTNSKAWVLSDNREITSHIDGVLLEQAYHDVLKRHSILRANVVVRNDSPEFIISDLRSGRFRLNVIDLSSTSYAIEGMQKIARGEAMYDYDLGKDPLVRATLVKISDHHHHFILSVHHIVFDGWSMPIFYRELGLFYESLTESKSYAPKPPHTQFTDYSAWVNKKVGGLEWHRAKSYWLEEFRNFDQDLAGLKGIERSNIGVEAGVYTFHMGKTLDTYIATRNEGNFTTYEMLLAAISAWFHLRIGSTEICIGTPISARLHPDTFSLIGFFINTVPIRIKLNGEHTFQKLLEDVHAKVSKVLEHQLYPFEMIVSELGIERGLGRNPIFDIGFTLHDETYGVMGDENSNVSIKAITSDAPTVKADMWFHAKAGRHGMELYVLYNKQLLSEDLINEQFHGFDEMLESFAIDHGSIISRSKPQQKQTAINIGTQETLTP